MQGTRSCFPPDQESSQSDLNKLQIKQIQIQLALEACPTIIGLAGEIWQLVSNIISNAIDAVPVKGTLKSARYRKARR